MKPPSQTLFAILIFFSISPNTFADWGREPGYSELEHFSKVSIGYASQNLKSPISNFGHTFLVFHNDTPPEADSLTIEFTGEAPDLLSNVAALFTSVPGKYTLNYLSSKVRDYDYENRNLWLYQSNLSKHEINALKQYFLQFQNSKFAYDFSQHNCAFYIAKSLADSSGHLQFKKYGLFVTPVGTLQWMRSNNLISSATYLPSLQIKALQEYDTSSDADQKSIVDFLNNSTTPDPENIKQTIGDNFSVITEYLLPREPVSNKRNYLFSIKRMFPVASHSIKPTAEDPSLSARYASASMLLLPKKNAAIFTISPGFVNLENETTSMQLNSTLETLRADIFADTHSVFRVEQFILARIESNQPGGYLRDGFTQALDVSYANYRTYLDKDYKETKVAFGRGQGWIYGKHTFSVLPLFSFAASQFGDATYVNGQINLRLNLYNHINDKLTYAAQINQSISKSSEIRQTLKLDLVYHLTKMLSVSLNTHQVMGKQKTTLLSGIRFTKSF